MSTHEVARRIGRLEQHGDEGTPTFTVCTDGPPMSHEEIDAYNRQRAPGDPVVVTIRIDRATVSPLVIDEEDNR
jgi:hypothetical protein